jgi:hypothetical protein
MFRNASDSGPLRKMQNTSILPNKYIIHRPSNSDLCPNMRLIHRQAEMIS